MTSTVSTSNEISPSSTTFQQNENTGTTTSETKACTTEKQGRFSGSENEGDAEGRERIPFVVTIAFEDSELENTMHSPICLDFFSKPVTLHCGHIYCSKCISHLIIRQRSCPEWRVEISYRPVRVYTLEHTIQTFLNNRKEDLKLWKARCEAESSISFDSFLTCGSNAHPGNSTQSNRGIQFAESVIQNISIANIPEGNEEAGPATREMPSVGSQEFWAVLEDEGDEENIAGATTGFGNRNPTRARERNLDSIHCT